LIPPTFEEFRLFLSDSDRLLYVSPYTCPFPFASSLDQTPSPLRSDFTLYQTDENQFRVDRDLTLPLFDPFLSFPRTSSFFHNPFPRYLPWTSFSFRLVTQKHHPRAPHCFVRQSCSLDCAPFSMPLPYETYHQDFSSQINLVYAAHPPDFFSPPPMVPTFDICEPERQF